MNIHGIQTPNYESDAQIERRIVYDKVIKTPTELRI